jgi:hypothetical protein
MADSLGSTAVGIKHGLYPPTEYAMVAGRMARMSLAAYIVCVHQHRLAGLPVQSY